jgi:hypothetical protein
MRRLGILVVVALIVAAYFIGFWPEHRSLLATQADLAMTRAQLAESQARVQLGQLLGNLLELSDVVAARDYGRAASLSSAWFDRVRDEAQTVQDPDAKRVLRQILDTRDGITSALARSDADVAKTLEANETRLREALGYPTVKATSSSS